MSTPAHCMVERLTDHLHTPHPVYAVVTLIPALMLAPALFTLSPIPASIQDAMTPAWSVLWLWGMFLSLLLVAVMTVWRNTRPEDEWPIWVDMSATAGTAIMLAAYAVALEAKFETLSILWSVAPYVSFSVFFMIRFVAFIRKIHYLSAVAGAGR